MDSGLIEIKKLEKMYLDSPNEVRDFIVARVLEIETETGCGCVIVYH